jgi:hypothetical protein
MHSMASLFDVAGVGRAFQVAFMFRLLSNSAQDTSLGIHRLHIGRAWTPCQWQTMVYGQLPCSVRRRGLDVKC